jgi:hypothetical protein
MPEAILFLIVVLKSLGKMKINENGKKNHAHVNSCASWTSRWLAFGTICRLFSRNNESIKH